MERLRHPLGIAVALAAVLLAPGAARAALTDSEAGQVRRDVETATHVDRVRSLVARPDLTADEAAGALAGPMAMVALDREHAAFFHDLVFSPASMPSRPVLAVAAVRAVLTRSDAVIAVHPLDLDRRPEALGELRRAYALVEEVADAGLAGNIPEAARADCARALAGHLARNQGVLLPEAHVAAGVSNVRAQAAIARLDLAPEGPVSRVDVADSLALTGARRALLIDRGVLLLDDGGPEARAASLRTILDRLFPGRQGPEAVLAFGDPSRGQDMAARDGAVVAVGDPATGEPSLWGDHAARPGTGDLWRARVARSLSALAVKSAIEHSPNLAAQIDRDGGPRGVAAAVTMLAIDAPRTVRLVTTGLLAESDASKRQSVAWLADAIGVLSAFGPVPAPHGGLSVPVGSSRAGVSTDLTAISLDGAGAATAFRLEGHKWRVGRDPAGAVTGLL